LQPLGLGEPLLQRNGGALAQVCSANQSSHGPRGLHLRSTFGTSLHSVAKPLSPLLQEVASTDLTVGLRTLRGLRLAVPLV
jgi:hypothetical protein